MWFAGHFSFKQSGVTTMSASQAKHHYIVLKENYQYISQDKAAGIFIMIS